MCDIDLGELDRCYLALQKFAANKKSSVIMVCLQSSHLLATTVLIRASECDAGLRSKRGSEKALCGGTLNITSAGAERRWDITTHDYFDH